MATQREYDELREAYIDKYGRRPRRYYEWSDHEQQMWDAKKEEARKKLRDAEKELQSSQSRAQEVLDQTGHTTTQNADDGLSERWREELSGERDTGSSWRIGPGGKRIWVPNETGGNPRNPPATTRTGVNQWDTRLRELLANAPGEDASREERKLWESQVSGARGLRDLSIQLTEVQEQAVASRKQEQAYREQVLELQRQRQADQTRFQELQLQRAEDYRAAETARREQQIGVEQQRYEQERAFNLDILARDEERYRQEALDRERYRNMQQLNFDRQFKAEQANQQQALQLQRDQYAYTKQIQERAAQQSERGTRQQILSALGYGRQQRGIATVGLDLLNRTPQHTSRLRRRVI